MATTLNATIQLRRGLRANLPAEGAIGEPFFCSDTRELFVGQGAALPLLQVGTTGLNFMGLWDSATDYLAGDLVGYGAALYVALRASTNAQPDVSGADWSFINAVQGPPGIKGDKGDKGDPGVGTAGQTGPKGDTQLIAATVYPTIAASLTNAVVDFDATGDNVIVTGLAGKTIKVYRAALVVEGSDTHLRFKDGPGGAPLSGPLPLRDHGSIMFDLEDKPYYETSQGIDLVLWQDGTAIVGGNIWYVQE